MQISIFSFLFVIIQFMWGNLYSQKKTESSRDNALIGEWLISHQLNCDGTEKRLLPIVKGMKYIFYANGHVLMTSPAMERKLNSLNTKGPKPELRWKTSNNILTITGPETGRGVLIQEISYKIYGDTR